MDRKKNYSYYFWGIIALLLLVGVLNYYGVFKKNPLNDILIVQVNDSKLYAPEFSEKLAAELGQYDVLLAKDPKITNFTKEKIINDFIHTVLIQDWAKKNNISVTNEEKEAQYKKIQKSYPDEISFKQALSDSGKTLKKFEAEMDYLALQKKVFDTLAQSLKAPDDSELLKYYESNKAQFVQKPLIRLRQIVFEKEDAALQLFNSLDAKSDLAELAKKYSVAPEAKNGGDTGWIEKGTLDIFDNAFSMKIKQRSGVVKSPYGYHIFEVIDKKPESKLSFTEAKNMIKASLMANKEQALYAEWLENQIKSAHILKNVEAINSIEVKTLGE